MKNIHVIPTDKPSRLFKFANQLHLDTIPKDYYKKYNIYITSDEEIKVEDYITDGYKVWQWKDDSSLLGRKKIILTTDQDLIKDGVQAIDDEFLEWFIKNPSCEFVEVKNGVKRLNSDGEEIGFPDMSSYKIIIPKEENFKHEMHVLSKEEVLANRCSAYEFIDFDKQETLEEALSRFKQEHTVLNLYPSNILQNIAEFGAKWQAERMYSEKDMIKLFDAYNEYLKDNNFPYISFKKWFEQFKKK